MASRCPARSANGLLSRPAGRSSVTARAGPRPTAVAGTLASQLQGQDRRPCRPSPRCAVTPARSASATSCRPVGASSAATRAGPLPTAGVGTGSRWWNCPVANHGVPELSTNVKAVGPGPRRPILRRLPDFHATRRAGRPVRRVRPANCSEGHPGRSWLRVVTPRRRPVRGPPVSRAAQLVDRCLPGAASRHRVDRILGTR